MATLFESLSSVISPQIVSALSVELDSDTSSVSQGLAAAGPLVTSSLSRMASTPSGVESLLKMLPQDEAGAFGGFGSLTSLASNLLSGGVTSNRMLSSVLGPGLNAIGASLTKALGFNAMPLLSLAVPAMMGLLSKTMQAQKLDATGLTDLLKHETTQFADDPANAGAMKLVNEALTAGDKAAAAIGSFGTDWAKVEAAPAAVLMAVTSADISGPIDTMKELEAARAALLTATKAAPAGSILAAAFGGGLTPDLIKSVRAMANDPDALTQLIADGSAAVKRHSPADAEAFKAAIRSIGKATAEAAKEGGFFGIGGTLVSDDEKAALAKIETALA